MLVVGNTLIDMNMIQCVKTPTSSSYGVATYLVVLLLCEVAFFKHLLGNRLCRIRFRP